MASSLVVLAKGTRAPGRRALLQFGFPNWPNRSDQTLGVKAIIDRIVAHTNGVYSLLCEITSLVFGPKLERR